MIASIPAPAALFIALAFVACGTEPAADSDVPLDAGLDVESGCTSNAECGDGYCVGPAGCDAVWSCQDENPCSAAAPFVACTCGGTYAYVAAGCPDRRWGYSEPALPEYLLGTPCPPAGPVERGNVVVLGTGFDEFDDGLAFLSLRDETHSANSPYGAVRVIDGKFEATWYGFFNPAEGDYTISVWFDDDASGDCSDADEVWSYTVPQPIETNDARVPASAEDGPGECPAGDD